MRLAKGLGAAGLSVLALAAAPPARAEGSAVSGRVVIGAEGLALRDVAPVVVYLEDQGEPVSHVPPLKPAVIAQERASFRPEFTVAVVGQAIDLPNRDDILHNVFSFSEQNSFDLGLYPRGQVRRITLKHPGIVRVYCSIHESMNATVLVVPSAHFAQVDVRGDFVIRDVPPARYRLRVWSDMLPLQEREIEVTSKGVAPLEISIEPRAPPVRSGQTAP